MHYCFKTAMAASAARCLHVLHASVLRRLRFQSLSSSALHANVSKVYRMWTLGRNKPALLLADASVAVCRQHRLRFFVVDVT